jgi:membrane protease YdiL (CAAX protease family)
MLLDGLLVACLVVVLPGYMLWRSIAGRGKPAKPKLGRYLRSGGIALTLDALVWIDWSLQRRSADALGIGSITTPGLIGLGIGVCAVVALGLGVVVQLRFAKPETRKILDDMLPTTSSEFVAFVAFVLVLGTSWELLYRGFLLWALTPQIGMIASVVVAASAYGVAHGYKNARTFAASLLSAFVFTIGYALTKNLWWLMVIHCSLPLMGAFAARSMQSGEVISSADDGAAIEGA